MSGLVAGHWATRDSVWSQMNEGASENAGEEHSKDSSRECGGNIWPKVGFAAINI